PAKSRFVNLDIKLRNPTRKTMDLPALKLAWKNGLGTIESERKDNLRVTRVLAYPSPEKEAVSLKPGDYPYNGYQWVGIDNRYYLFAILPQSGQFGHIIADKSKTNPGEVILATDPFSVEPGQTKTFSLKLYGGPKGYTQLKKLGLGLDRSVDF